MKVKDIIKKLQTIDGELDVSLHYDSTNNICEECDVDGCEEYCEYCDCGKDENYRITSETVSLWDLKTGKYITCFEIDR